MRRVTLSFVIGISLAIACLLMTMLRASLLAGILVGPGLLLSEHLIPRSAQPSQCSDAPPIECIGGSPAWMYFHLVFGVLIDGVLFTWPVLLVLRVFGRKNSK
jgi:hypothetical protein